MRKLALLAAAASAAIAVPASASVVVDGNSYGVGQSFQIYFDGFGGTPPAVIPGLTSNITFTVHSITGTQYQIDYLIDNTSSAPITASRVSVFGFGDVAPNFTSATVDGVFGTVNSGNVPNFGVVEFCATSVNCAGGGSGGVLINTPAADSDGRITLNYSGGVGDITLDDFFVRYQSIAGAGRVTSAIGREIPPPGVPEPGTWAMMIAGFGATGFAMRRTRRKKVLLAQAA